MKVVFKNVERSDLVVMRLEHLSSLISEKIPSIEKGDLVWTFEMENSRIKAGPDHYLLSLRIVSGRLRGMFLKKGGSDPYRILAEFPKVWLRALRGATSNRTEKMKRSRNLRREMRGSA